MAYNPQVGDSLDDLDTPSMIVDLDAMEVNIATMMGLLKPTGIDIRPHLKTTKSPALAAKLIAAGCKGGCVAKVSEAEVMMAGGIDDVFITSEVVGPVKVKRLVALAAKNPKLRCVVDSAVGAQAIDQALKEAGVSHPLLVLLDLDVGHHRTGVQPSEAVALCRELRGLQNLKLIGVHGYEGHLQHMHGDKEREADCRAAMGTLAGVAQSLRDDGHDISVVTTGGTGTAEFCSTSPGITEVQPGSFIFMDVDYRAAVGGARFSNSLTLLSTVISKPELRRVVIDSGLKSLTEDSGWAEPKALPGVKYEAQGDEHGALIWEEGVEPGLAVGNRVEMIPSHIDPTINLHDFYYAHRKGIIEEIWPVAARGKVQ
ncbi:hypothetical protein GQ53DRAFT_745068 [Thozetella sp. PMI_491]|nr:hypothetical protein GQ53DRAFT_745068 [Thozetella sp. PMI_491]